LNYIGVEGGDENLFASMGMANWNIQTEQ
jgi:hypothetical protein